MKTVMKSESQSESYSLPFHCAIGGYVGQSWGDSVGPDVGKGGTIKITSRNLWFVISLMVWCDYRCEYEV